MKPKVGRVYSIAHRRYGKAIVEVIASDATWAHVKVIEGILQHKRLQPFWPPGFAVLLATADANWRMLGKQRKSDEWRRIRPSTLLQPTQAQ